MTLSPTAWLEGVGVTGGILARASMWGYTEGRSLRMLLSLQLLPLHPHRPSAILAIPCCQPSLVRGCPSGWFRAWRDLPLELGRRCCSAEMASLCCSSQVSTSFQDKRERKAIPEPQDPQVGDPSPRAEGG